VIVVGGLPLKCPPAVYEGAFLIDDMMRRRNLRDAVEIEVITPEAAPLEASGAEAGEMVLELLAKRDIRLRSRSQAKSVNHEKKLVNFTQGEPVPFDLLIGTPVHRVPKVLVDNEVSRGSWLEVDRETLETEFPGVYAIGDVNTVPIAGGHALPKAGVFAHGEAEVVARNVSAEINGGQPIWAFGGQGACFMETGRNKGCYIEGNYYMDPPHVKVRREGRFSHFTKAGFERIWLWRWF
jgi:sulfide:quinone oxidoreductase